MLEGEIFSVTFFVSEHLELTADPDKCVGLRMFDHGLRRSRREHVISIDTAEIVS